jgi:uncharacterized membrane protein YdjX (TVP38/TMEM64 family)
MEKQRKKHVVIHIILAALFLAALVFLTIKYGPVITRMFSRPQQTREYLLSFGLAAPLVYILFQVLQIVIAFIPGEVVQIAGGYVFGTALGTLYSLIGAALGTFIVILIVRAVGFSLVRLLVPAKTLERFNFVVNSTRSDLAVFILFLAPGLPKDTLTYIAGLTPIKPLKFVVISVLARFPGLLGSAYVGAHLAKKSYGPVIIVSAVTLVLFILGLIFKDKVIEKVRGRWPGRKAADSPPDPPPPQP